MSFTFSGKSVAIWGLLKDVSNSANFSVAIDGEIVAASVSNQGTSGANALLYDTGALNGDGPHTLVITKIGATGQLDIGNARIGYDYSALYAAIKDIEAIETADYTNKVYLNALDVYTAPALSQADIDKATSLLITSFYGIVSYTISDNTVTKVKVAAANTGASIFVAIYDNAGRLINIWNNDAVVGIYEYEVNLNLTGAAKARVFLWDENYIPLCDAKSISF
jgi:hypothetical protein